MGEDQESSGGVESESESVPKERAADKRMVRGAWDSSIHASPVVSGGRAVGAEHQLGGAQHQALRDRVQELSLCQYSAGCPGPRGDLQQPDCDSQRNRAGSLPLSDLGFGNCSNTGSHLRGLGCAAAPS